MIISMFPWNGVESLGNFGISVSADGKRMAISNLKKYSVDIRELPTGKLLHQLSGSIRRFVRPVKVQCFVCCKHACLVVLLLLSQFRCHVCCSLNLIRCLALHSSCPFQVHFPWHQFRCLWRCAFGQVCFTPRDTLLITEDVTKRLQEWDVAKSECMRTLALDGSVGAVDCNDRLAFLHY